MKNRWLAVGLLGLSGAMPVAAASRSEDSLVLAFCGTYIREWGLCGNVPQNSMLEQEALTIDGAGGHIYQRTPYGIFKNYGTVKAATQTTALTRTLWFEDDAGNIRNVNAELNPSAPNMFIRRKGQVTF
jgi:hypothetical protein